MSPLRTLARPMLAAVFIREAAAALRHPDDHVERIRSCGRCEERLEKVSQKVAAVPASLRTLTRLHAGVTLAAATCLAIGKAPRASAAVLAITAVPATVISHPVRTKADRKENLADLMARAGLLGGLCFAALDRGGDPSLAWRFGTWRNNRKAAHGEDPASG